MSRSSTDSFGQFLNEAGRITLLRADEEIHLGKQVQAMLQLQADKPHGPYGKLQRATLKRGQRAKDRMVQANLRLVVMLARKYFHKNPNSGITMEDLVQEGSIGLMRAVEKFDPQRGYKFSTYAYWWVKQGMSRYLHQRSRMIRLPHHLAEKIFAINKLTHQLSNTLGRRPTANELAEALQLDRQEFDLLMQRASGVVSLDQLVTEDGSPLLDLIGTEEDSNSHLNDLNQTMHLERLHQCINQLDPKERDMLILRFGLHDNHPHSYKEIGEAYQLSRERVRQYCERGQRKLRMILLSTPAMQPRQQPIYKPWTLAGAA